eukprot:Pgem_evm1s6876
MDTKLPIPVAVANVNVVSSVLSSASISGKARTMLIKVWGALLCNKFSLLSFVILPLASALLNNIRL